MKLNKILMFSAIAAVAVGVLGAGAVKLTGHKLKEIPEKVKKIKLQKQ